MKEAKALEALAQALAEKVKNGKSRTPSLRLVKPPSAPVFDSITRDCMLSRIRRLAKAYQLHMIVEQATFNHAGIDSLEDAEVSALLHNMERARECLIEGVAFDDAGLMLNTADMIDHWD